MEIFLISDTHFGQQKLCEVWRQDNTAKLRPFSTAREMDEIIINNWNKTVNKNDIVLHLGDVTLEKQYLNYLKELNGIKTLIAGNHDTFNASVYLEYFNDIKACSIIDKHLLTHYPVHRNAITARGYNRNIHGHIHDCLVMFNDKIDLLYKNVCVEYTDYTPVSFDVIKSNI
jgi:calcineurin-like phosphoesterase family protein